MKRTFCHNNYIMARSRTKRTFCHNNYILGQVTNETDLLPHAASHKMRSRLVPIETDSRTKATARSRTKRTFCHTTIAKARSQSKWTLPRSLWMMF